MATRTISRRGFALPTILLASTLMMIVLVVTVNAAASVNVAMGSQYLNQLAREAAESGAIRASDCVRQKGGIPSWGANMLYPTSGCSGDSSAQCDFTQSATFASQCNLIRGQTPTVKTFSSFVVYPATGSGVGNTFKSVGTSGQIRSDGTVISSSLHTVTLSSRTSTIIGTRSVTFGYGANTGAYFATLGQDGVVRALGNNYYGQLGNSTRSDTATPTVFPLPNGEVASNIATSFFSQGFNMFVTTVAGNVYGAGLNDSGQLGIGGGASYVSTPTKMNLPTGQIAVKVAVLGTDTYILTQNAGAYSLYVTGDCSQGVSGVLGCSTSFNTPQKITFPPGQSPTSQIALDNHSVYVVTKSNSTPTRYSVYGWGRNNFGQLGNGNPNQQNAPIQIGTFGSPGKPDAQQIAFDGDTFYVLDSNNTVWGAGRGTFGELCGGRTGDINPNFVQVSGAGTISQIATDQWTLVTLTNSGNIYSCGWNTQGQLGNGNTSNQSNAVQMPMPTGAGNKFTYIYNAQASVGPGIGDTYNNTYAITDTGRVVGTGSNTYGQLGILKTHIQNASDGKCVNVSGNNTANNALFTTYTCQPGASEQMSWNAADGTIQDLNSGKCMSPNGTPGSNPVLNGAVRTYTCGANAVTQKFNVVPGVNNTFSIVNVSTGFCLGIAPPLITYQNCDQTSAAQQFTDLFDGVSVSTPVLLNTIDGVNTKADDVKTGFGTTVIHTTNQMVYTVGNNSNGQLGDGTTNNSSLLRANRYTNTIPITIY